MEVLEGVFFPLFLVGSVTLGGFTELACHTDINILILHFLSRWEGGGGCTANS